VLDVDGVVLRSHFLLEMSRRVGLWTYARAWGLCFLFNAGLLPFFRLLRLVYARFAGRAEEEAREVLQAMAVLPGAVEAAAALRAAGHRVVAVSSGVPDAFLAPLAEQLGLDAHAGIECPAEDRDGTRRLDGTVAGELAEPGGKVERVEGFHRDWDTDWAHTAVVVDDRNNLDLVERAALSIGVRPNWPVRRRVTHVADEGDMREVRRLIEGHLAGEPPRPRDQETFRKGVHGAGALVPFAALVSLPATLAVLAAAGLLYAVSEVWRLNGLSLPGFTWVTRHTVRPEELRRPALGPICLVGGCAACLALFPWPVAAAAILLASLADTAAAVVGRRLGRRRLPYNRHKSYAGVAAFVVAGLVSTVWLLPLPACVLACLVAAAVESLPLGDWDNLLVPLAAALCATLVV